MKKYIKYSIFALISLILFLIGFEFENTISILGYPYIKLGELLRGISLSSGFGNIISIIIYILISLIPVCVIAYIHKKQRLTKSKLIILSLLTISQFITIYYCINYPVLLNLVNPNLITTSTLKLIKTIILTGMAFINYLLILIYFLINIKNSKKINARKAVQIIIDIVIFFITLSIFVMDLNSFIVTIKGNTPLILPITVFISNLAVSIITILLLIKINELFIEIDNNNLDNNLQAITSRVFILSFISILVSLISQILIIIVNYMVLDNLNNISFELHLPLMQILLALISLLLAKHFRRVDELKEDHSLII